MKTLYVSDLDGTLLNSHTALSAKSCEILNRLIDRGLLFTCATARSLSSAAVILQGLRLRLPLSCNNGTMLRSLETGGILSMETFTSAEREIIISCLESKSLSSVVYSLIDGVERASYRIDRINKALRFYLDNRRGDPRMRPVSTATELYAGELYYFTNIGSFEELQPIYDRFRDNSIAICTFQQELYRAEYWCELMPKTATKAHGLQQLKQLLNCDRVVCFGDAVNDLPMFAAAEESYAVENAVPELKRAATGILGCNDADAVAQWLEKNAVF